MATTSNQLDLAGVRQGRGITIEQITQSTKISSRFLKAIEEEDFDKLPGGVFNTSYIRQYAAAIGFEANQLLDYYYARVGRHVH